MRRTGTCERERRVDARVDALEMDKRGPQPDRRMECGRIGVRVARVWDWSCRGMASQRMPWAKAKGKQSALLVETNAIFGVTSIGYL